MTQRIATHLLTVLFLVLFVGLAGTTGCHGPEDEHQYRSPDHAGAAIQPVGPDARAAYERGRGFLELRTRVGLKESLREFGTVITLEPRFAPAWAGIATSSCLLGLYSVLPPADVMPRCKTSAERALELDDALAEAWATFGLAQYLYDWDFAAAETSFRRAIELDPTYSTVHHWLAMLLTATGRHEEAVAEMTAALAADPASRLLHVKLGTVLTAAGDLDAAEEQLLAAIERFPDYPLARRETGFLYLKAQRLDMALAAFEGAAAMSGGASKSSGGLGYAYAALDRTDEAQAALAALRAVEEVAFLPPMYLALILTGLDERDRALAWLERAEEIHDPGLVYLRVKPGFERLYGDPRFEAVAKRVGL